jgi:group I intron endonuclease
MTYNVVYQIQNTINGKVYIGSTVKYRYRKNRHLYLLRHNKHESPKLQNAFNKYGEKSFRFSLLIENVSSIKLLRKYEQYFIDSFDATHPKFGYNIAINAMGGSIPKLYEAFGSKKTLKEWAAEYTVPEDRLYGRIHRGYSVEDALLNRRKNRIRTPKLTYPYRGSPVSVSEIVERFGIPDTTLRRWLARKTMDEILSGREETETLKT